MSLPELKLEPRCTVCRHATTHAGILKIMHRMYRDEGLAGNEIWRRTRSIFERHGIVPPSSRAVRTHLQNHVDHDMLRASAAALGDFDLPDPDEVNLDRLADNELGLRRSQPEDLALGKNETDYHAMADLFTRITRRIAAIDADPTAFLAEDGKHSVPRLKLFADMISTAKSILESLNKMRNNDRMTLSILEQHTKRYALAAADPLSQTFSDIINQLGAIDHPAAQKLQQQLMAEVPNQVYDILQEAAIASLLESQQKFDLLN